MLSLDENIITHNLVVKDGSKLVKQNPRKLHPKVSLWVTKEIDKLLKVGFIRPIDYTPWIASIVPIKKPIGEIRV